MIREEGADFVKRQKRRNTILDVYRTKLLAKYSQENVGPEEALQANSKKDSVLAVREQPSSHRPLRMFLGSNFNEFLDLDKSQSYRYYHPDFNPKLVLRRHQHDVAAEHKEKHPKRATRHLLQQDLRAGASPTVSEFPK